MTKTFKHFVVGLGAASGAVATAAQLLPMVAWYMWVGSLAGLLLPVAGWAYLRGRRRQIGTEWFGDEGQDCILEVPASDDMLAAACRYAKTVYGRDALDLERFRIWRNANPLSIAVMRCDRGHYQGHIDVLPLQTDAAEKLIRGTLNERSLDIQHILPPELMLQAKYLYVAGICVREHDQGNDDALAAQLIGGAANLVQRLYGSKERVLFAIVTTEDGRRLLESPAMDHHVIKEGAARPDGHPVYALRLNQKLIETVLARAQRRAVPARLSLASATST
jgi:hypothetical protein